MNSLLTPDANSWPGDIPSRPLKLAVVREEFVALTKDPLIAMVLNQLFYWTLRVKDFDLLLEEEKTSNPECNVPFRHGWIYKTAKELINETMLCVSKTTMYRYLNFLIQGGWLDERTNQSYKWDKTTQYRVNLRKLQEDLFNLGYTLPGFSLPPKENTKDLLKPAETSNAQNEPSRVQTEPSKAQIDASKVKNCTFLYLNRDYPEIKSKDHTQGAYEFSSHEFNSFEGDSNSIPHQMIEIWKNHIGQEVIHLSSERSRQLTCLLQLYFQNDPFEWESFCKRIQESPFLMGQGANKWHINFDWILIKGNLLKVLEGNYDKPEWVEQRKETEFRKTQEDEKKAILDTIEDPIWRGWCTQLKEQLSLSEFKAISNAAFSEFDGRLVWVESEDKATLNKIEDLWLKLSPAVERTFPKVRAIRTKLKEGINPKTSPLACLDITLDNINIPFQISSVKGEKTPSFPIDNDGKPSLLFNNRKEIAC